MTELKDMLSQAAATPARHPSVDDLRAELGRRHRRRRNALALLCAVAVFGAAGTLAARPTNGRGRAVVAGGGPTAAGAHLGDGFCEPQLTNAGFAISGAPLGEPAAHSKDVAIAEARLYAGTDSGTYDGYLASVANPIAPLVGLGDAGAARPTWVIEASGLLPRPRSTDPQMRGAATNPSRSSRMVVFIDDATLAPVGAWADCPDPVSGSAPALVDPTFASPTRPPEGLRLIEGGSRASTDHGAGAVILLASADGRQARLNWLTSGVPGGCAAPQPATTIRGAGAAPTTPTTLMPSTPAAAPFTSGNLAWCEGDLRVVLSTVGIDETAARALAASVHASPGKPEELTIASPPGFAAGRPDTNGPVSVLVFRPDPAPASRPQLYVRVTAAWTTDLRLLKADGAASSATDVTVGGRPGFVGPMPGGARYQQLTLLFDDRTIVTLQGDGLTAAQLVDAAASLAPADPALAPSVIGDASRCDRLGLCG